MDKLTKANKIVLSYFTRTCKDHDLSAIENMLLLVQMGGHAAGFDAGVDAAETYHKEDEAMRIENMNEDLKMRLTHTPTPEEERFFDALCIDLMDQMIEDDVHIFHRDIIENGEDDTAYVEQHSDSDGYDVFFVYIDSRLDFGSRCDYLIHELAHVMSWRHKYDDHGEFWGVCYAVLYRQYLKTYKTFWKIR